MLGNAAMIAVLLAPTANIARHDDHRIGANAVRWSIVMPWSPSRSDFKRTSPMAGRSSAPCARSRRTRSWSGSRTPATCRAVLAPARAAAGAATPQRLGVGAIQPEWRHRPFRLVRAETGAVHEELDCRGLL